MNARWCFRVSRPRTKATPALSTASFALSLLLLVAPATSRADNLFVSNQSGNTIEEFNSSGVGTVFATGTSGAAGLAFDSAGNLYVAEQGIYSIPYSGSIEKFNTNGVGTVFASGLNDPSGLAFQPVPEPSTWAMVAMGIGVVLVGRRLSSRLCNQQWRLGINGQRNFLLSRPAKVLSLGFAAVLVFSFAIDFTQADTIYVGTDYSPDPVLRYDLDGQGSVFATNGLNQPWSMAVDSSGNLYVGNYGSGTIAEFNTNGNGSVFPSGLGGVAGLAFDTTGNLYVADQVGNTIYRVDSGGHESVFATTGLNQPRGMAFDSSGNLYVANFISGTIEKFDPTGQGSVFASGLVFPMGIAIDSSGNVYAAEYGYNTIEEFDPNGVGTVFAQGGYLFNPDALAFDGSGNLYVANWGSDAVIRFDPSGNVFNFASGLNSPSSIAIQVPEPSTWAMVAMGIGVVLVGLRLRRMTNIGVQG